MKRIARLSVLTAALALAAAAPAAADTTLGSSAQPSLSNTNACNDNTHVVLQHTENPSTPYFVPGPGKITAWQTNTTGSTNGAALTLVVLKQTTATTWSVVGTDPQSLPTPLPPTNVASFTTAAPISVSGGEMLGLYGSPTTTCFFAGGTIPAASSLDLAGAAVPPSAGQTLSEDPIGPSPPSFTLNLAANFAPTPAAVPTPLPLHKKKCKKKHKKKGKHRAATAKKKKCKKKKHH
jgi:hypothetical protein